MSDAAAHLFRQCRHHAARSPRAGSDAAVSRRAWGNPSSLHRGRAPGPRGDRTGAAQVAALLDAEPGEIVFTASGTEADNLALQAMLAAESRPSHMITSAIEHPAMLETVPAPGAARACRSPICRSGERRAWSIRPILSGCACGRTTRLVSIMAANNVTGTLQPIAELGRIAHGMARSFIPMRCKRRARCRSTCVPADRFALAFGTQAAWTARASGRCTSARASKLSPLLHGGGQERGLRSGTENVAGDRRARPCGGIAAPKWPTKPRGWWHPRPPHRDDRRTIRNAYLIGHRYRRLPGHICLGFAGQEGEAIKLLLDLDEQGIAVSSGSACSAIMPASPRTSCRPWASIRYGARFAADFAGAVQHRGRGGPVFGSAAQAVAAAATHLLAHPCF